MWLKNFNKTVTADSWSVILNPLQEEVKKRSTAQQLQSFFSVTLEEARELIENTPIILLDTLSEDSAEKIKEVFTSSGLDVVITSETLVKRKCFRTVWPKEPTLDQIIRQGALRGSMTQKVIASVTPSAPKSQPQPQTQAPAAVQPVPAREQKAEKPRQEKPIVSEQAPSPAAAFGKSLKDFEDKNKKLEMEKSRVQELLLDAQKENEELRLLKKDYEKLKKEITEYRSQREQFEGAKIEYEGWVRELQEEKSKLEYRVRNLSSDLTGKENQYTETREQIDRMKEELERFKQDLAKETQSVKHYSGLANKKDSEVEKLRKDIENRDQVLQHKDQQIASLNQSKEQQIASLNQSKDREIAALNQKFVQTESIFQEELKKQLMQQENHLNGEIKGRDEIIVQLNEKHSKTNQILEDFRGRYAKTEEDLEGKRQQLDELKKESDFIRERLEVEKRMSEKRYKEKSDQFDSIKEVYDRQQIELEALKKEFNRVSSQFREEHEKATEYRLRWEKDRKDWTDLRQVLESKINSLTSEFAAVSQAYQKTAQDLEANRSELSYFKKELLEKTKIADELFSNLTETKKNLDELRVRFEEKSIENESLSGRLDRSQASFEQACNKISSLEAENEELKRICYDLTERVKRIPDLELTLKRLENQLEIAQRHIKDVTNQKEQQEIVEKRLRLQNELQERESQLKQLIQKQEQLEQDVMTRQEVIKKILEEQEAVQKEIIKGKQAQKHLVEVSRFKDSKSRTNPKQSLQIFTSDSEGAEALNEEFSSTQDSNNS